MEKVQIQTEIDIQTLLSQLETVELEEFLRQVSALIIRRKSNDKKIHQAKLLQELNEECVLSEAHKRMFRELAHKRQAGKMNLAEKEAFSQLIIDEENLRLKRINILGELAQIKGVSLPELIQELGIHPPD